MLKVKNCNILSRTMLRATTRYFSSEPSKPLTYYLSVLGVKNNFTQ